MSSLVPRPCGLDSRLSGYHVSMSLPNCTVSSQVSALLVTIVGYCFSPVPSSPPLIVFSNPSTSHINTQSCRRNKKKSRGQLKSNIEMLCQTHQHLHNLTSHILFHTTLSTSTLVTVWEDNIISDSQPLCPNVNSKMAAQVLVQWNPA